MQTIKPKIPASALAELEALKDRPIDLSDAPEVTDWTGAKRGMFRFNQHSEPNLSQKKDDLFEQNFVEWLNLQPTYTKQKIQDLVRTALNLGQVSV